MTNLTRILLLISVSFWGLSCNDQSQTQIISEINEWHKQRIHSLKQKDSWLSLAGLYRLEEGTQSFGSDSANEMVFPEKAPPTIGTITKQGKRFTVSIRPGVTVTSDSKPVRKMELSADEEAPDILHHGSFLWYVMERRGHYYLRLKDTGHPNFTSFDGIERFPVSLDWRVKAEFHPFESPKLIQIPDIIGDVYQDTLFGTLKFEIDGEPYSLAPLGNPQKEDKFFIIFGDNTNGETTYGGGRYLYTPTPGDNGITYIDFNKAYNPPCVFSDFATCPLPPFQNRLDLAVSAGEKKYKSAGAGKDPTSS